MSADSGPFTGFVVLQPEPALGSLIQRFKDQVRSLAGEQLYLADPPHLTVYLADFASADALLARWPQIVARTRDLSVNLIGWHVFEADSLTGGQTLVCDLAAHDKHRLRTLQRDVVDLFAPLHDPAAARSRLAPRIEHLSAEQRQCVVRHGFPFLGVGWEPQFTIASIRPAEWPEVWQALRPQSPHGSYRCVRWRLGRLRDGKPVALDGLGDLF